MKTLALLISLTLSQSVLAGTAVRCRLVKTEDLGKKEKAPSSIVITMIAPEAFRYTFTSVHGKKLVKCKVPKATMGSPLDKNHVGFEHYAIGSEEPNECMDAYLDLKSKVEKKKWVAVFLTNTDGTATYDCK